jgi:hypothetical protein
MDDGGFDICVFQEMVDFLCLCSCLFSYLAVIYLRNMKHISLRYAAYTLYVLVLSIGLELL